MKQDTYDMKQPWHSSLRHPEHHVLLKIGIEKVIIIASHKVIFAGDALHCLDWPVIHGWIWPSVRHHQGAMQ
jgi:hypothetical protein